MKARKGLALITVMGFFVVLSLLIVALIQGMAGYVNTGERMIRRVKAHYLAEAGINDAMMKLFHHTWGYPITTDITYNIMIDTPEGAKQVDMTIQTNPSSTDDLPYRITASTSM
jgi:hypothetical protein